MKRQETHKGRAALRRAGQALAHGALFAGINVGMLLWLTDAMMPTLDRSGLITLGMMSAGELGAHLIVCALLHGGLVMAARRMRAPRARRVLKAARGTVITETLIAILPFLLLMSGLAQMTMNNMAGVLTNYAAYQAGRAVWVNEPHPNTKSKSKAVATLAAAASVAPVVSGSLTNTHMGSADLDAMRATMYSSFAPVFGLGGLSALMGSSAVKPLAKASALNYNQWTSFDNALDSDSFSVRAARKLTFAHACTEVEVINGAEVGAKVKFSHYQSFPWFGWITGKFGVKAGRIGYYLLITRTYSVPSQAR